MLDRYRLAAEIREFLIDRDRMTARELAEELAELFVARCREMYGDKPEKK